MAKHRIVQTMRRAGLSAATETCDMNTERLTDFVYNSMTQFNNRKAVITIRGEQLVQLRHFNLITKQLTQFSKCKAAILGRHFMEKIRPLSDNR